MTRRTPAGRHRASATLSPGRRTATSTLSVVATGGLLASSFLVAAAQPQTDADDRRSYEAVPAASSTLAQGSTALGLLDSASSDTARAAAAPADAENAEVGQLGFVGVAPAPAEEAEEETISGSATASDARSEESASRSELREEAPAPEPEPAPEPAPEPEPAPPPASGGSESAIGWAYNHLGMPYSWGSDSGGGFDCSGFVKAAYAAAGMSLPHGSSAQYSATSRVSLDSIQRGDLLFYSQGSGIYHVAIYLGDGQVIHSLRDWSGGFSGSKINHMNYSPGLFAAGRP
ncbi:C40 family peptidase [Ornithinimicrobium cavernae]|uniref:C40 family peptidase n=1 Tax=Ornithinimicrobium cavernae TaxID=2666047 RepID=UPI000D697873|nr:C40 family peptidase [Ornithinimicrobium cavernae]